MGCSLFVDYYLFTGRWIFDYGLYETEMTEAAGLILKRAITRIAPT